MKKILLIAATALCLTGCKYDPAYRIKNEHTGAVYTTDMYPDIYAGGVRFYTQDGRHHVLTGDITIEQIK